MNFVLKKFIFNKRNMVLVGLSLLFILFFSVWLRTTSETLTSQESSNISLVKQNIQQAQSGVQQVGVPKTQKDKDNLSQTQKILELSKAQLNALEKKDYNTYASLQNQLNILELQQDEDGLGANPTPGQEIAQLKDSIAFYEAAKKSGQTVSTNMGSNTTAFGNLAVSFPGLLSSIVVIVLFAILCGDFFGLEIPNGLRHYYLLKEKKSKILLRYNLVPVVVIFGIILLVFAILFVYDWIVYGLGSPIYPYGYPNYVTIPVWEIIVWSLLYFLVSLLFIVTLGQLISMIVKKSYISASILSLVFVGYFLLEQQSFMRPILRWIPFTYVEIENIMALKTTLFNNASFLVGLIYLLVCSSIFFITTNILFSRYVYRKA